LLGEDMVDNKSPPEILKKMELADQIIEKEDSIEEPPPQ
jgi:hypothetical protein